MHICRMYMATVDDVYNSARVMSVMYLVCIYIYTDDTCKMYTAIHFTFGFCLRMVAKNTSAIGPSLFQNHRIS